MACFTKSPIPSAKSRAVRSTLSVAIASLGLVAAGCGAGTHTTRQPAAAIASLVSGAERSQPTAVDVEQIDACLAASNGSGDVLQGLPSDSSSPQATQQAALAGGTVDVWKATPADGSADYPIVTIWKMPSAASAARLNRVIRQSEEEPDLYQSGTTIADVNQGDTTEVLPCLPGFTHVNSNPIVDAVAAAKELLLTAQTDVETYATEHDGSYAGVTVGALAGLDRSIGNQPSGWHLSVDSAGASSYSLSMRSGNSRLTVSNDQGVVRRTCANAAPDCSGGIW